MPTFELLANRKPAGNSFLTAEVMSLDNIALHVLPKERWDPSEQARFEAVDISVFELVEGESTEPQTLLKSRDDLARRVVSIGSGGVDMGELPGLLYTGKEEFSTKVEAGKIYDLFILGKSRRGTRNITGFMRWSKLNYGDTPLINIEEAKYLVSEGLGVTQDQSRGTRARVGIGRIEYRPGDVVPGISLTYSNSPESSPYSMISSTIISACPLKAPRTIHILRGDQNVFFPPAS